MVVKFGFVTSLGSFLLLDICQCDKCSLLFKAHEGFVYGLNSFLLIKAVIMFYS